MDVAEPSGRANGGPGSPMPDLLTSRVERVVETVLPTRWGTFRMIGYRDGAGTVHVALVRGLLMPPGPSQAPLVRVHSECLTGDALGSYRCDCGDQLQAGLAAIAAEGSGALLYVRGHEGRGIGLLEKLRAYQLQDCGADTLDANLQLGHLADARRYDQSAGMLVDLGITKVRLLSSNPAKEQALAAAGIEVVHRAGLVVPAREQSAAYLRTKRDRMGHDLPDLQHVWRELSEGAIPDTVRGTLGAELVDRYGPLVASPRPGVIAQLGQSLDGFIAARTGRSAQLTGPEDHQQLHRLRALVDAVLVGANTVIADDCQLTVRHVTGRHPVRVVLDPRGRIPREARVLTDPAAPTLWLVGPDASVPQQLAPHVEVVTVSGSVVFDPAEVLHMLRARNLSTVLVEGGGRLVSSFVAAKLVDRLYLTTAPILIGDGVPGLRFSGAEDLTGALTGRSSRRWTLGQDICTEIVFDTTT